MKISPALSGGLALLIGISWLSLATPAQQLRLRSNINPPCTRPDGTSTSYKFADIYADGNIAVQGTYSCRGVFIYDLTNPDAPLLASHYNPGNNIQFLEAIVVGNRGYFGSGNGAGVHIVDLSDPFNPQLLGTVDPTHGNGFSAIHEMVVEGNLLYENFNGFANKLIRVINISDPANPLFVREINPTEIRWVHAMHIRANRMFTSGWGNSSTRGRTEIYDISGIETNAPALLGFIEDPTGVTSGNRMHSSWSSEDGNYLYSARETNDGLGDVRTYDISNPAAPVIVDSISMTKLGINAVTPHNPVVSGNYLYVSWYQAGIQVFDISEPSEPKKIAEYDTYPDEFAPPSEEKKALIDDTFDLICGSESLQNLLPDTYDGNWAVYPLLGTDRILAGDMKNGLFVLDATNIGAQLKNRVSDFDGDLKTDFSRYTPSTGTWTIEFSASGEPFEFGFGLAGDKLVSADYDGDGVVDIAVWRPSDGVWYIRKSSDSGYDFRQFGLAGDIPVPGDYDADGKADIAVYRPSSGVWYIFQSTLGVRIVRWGLANDRPMAGDFEGDGKADLAVYRPATGIWYVLRSSSSIPLIFHFGVSTDKPLLADFDGDGKSDFSVYRPSEGNWYSINSSDLSLTVTRFGIPEDTPVPSDFDGDGKADIAVVRPSSGVWYMITSANSIFYARGFGNPGDVPSPSSRQP
ncbi:MAG: FG-GAP-like repeat-containing protein [Acidobacteriota bacterium]|nr:FG-GAP-like repeat-containing protein [Acidobacteriota bacterium]MDH3531091.1 FG-GAP-like repeat-containing protein [Acidobacteriota bacterium]